MKRLGMFAAASAAVWVLLAGFAASSIAAPKGIVDLGKKLFEFNVIAKPGGWDPSAGNACNGSRIFFAEDNGGGGNTLGTIAWSLDPTVNGFEITDCNGTDGNASVLADENVNFVVAIRVMGPVTSALNLVCDTSPLNVEGVNDDLCIIDSGTIHKGNTFTPVMKNVADDEFESVLWSLSGNWKIFQVRVYELLN